MAAAIVPLAHGQDATSMRARHLELRGELLDNQFQRPLYLASRESDRSVQGEVYAVIAQPYRTIGTVLQGTENWCDILILHLNVKGCAVAASRQGDVVSVNIGRKHDQPLKDAHRLDFLHELVAAESDYLQVTLKADSGPLGTTDYVIRVEVAELDAERSFLHFSYSYGFGLASRVAMSGYLATTGRDKVGFTIVGREGDGRPVYTRKMRGVIERNAMRYYLAVEAYLDALSAAGPKQVETRLQNWYTAVERYPIQLHELERGQYLAMKRKEILRQQNAEEPLHR